MNTETMVRSLADVHASYDGKDACYETLMEIVRYLRNDLTANARSVAVALYRAGIEVLREINPKTADWMNQFGAPASIVAWTKRSVRAPNATLYTYCGSSVQQEMAVRHSDGARFTRSQYRDPRYGYKWTAWERTSAMPVYTSNGDDPACWSETGSGWVLASWQHPVRLPR